MDCGWLYEEPSYQTLTRNQPDLTELGKEQLGLLFGLLLVEF